MTNTTPQIPIKKNDDEIDLIQLAKTLWNGRRIIIKSVAICGALALFVALFSPKSFNASSTLVPQISKAGSSLGGLSSLAALAGVNMDAASSGSDVLSPLVYPKIISSAPFQLQLMNSEFTFEKVSKPVTLYEYFTNIQKPSVLGYIKKYTIGLPGVLIAAIKGKKEDIIMDGEGNKLIAFTEKQDGIRSLLDDCITLEVDPKNGYLTLNTEMPEGLLVAQVNQRAQELLQKFITDFKIKKTTEQLRFIENRYAESKKEFEKVQDKQAQYIDRNKSVSSAMASVELDRIRTDYQIAFGVYSELSKQLEQAKIKVKEDTPVFAIVEPTVVPIKKSKPSRPLILFVGLFLGGVIGVGIVFGKEFWIAIKKKWKEYDS